MPISLKSSRNDLVERFLSRMSVSLCWTKGWPTTVTPSISHLLTAPGWRLKNRSVACQDARAAKLIDAPSHAPPIHPPTEFGYQCDPGPSCRARDRGASRPQGWGGTARCHSRSKRKRVPDVALTGLVARRAQLRSLKAQIWSLTA